MEIKKKGFVLLEVMIASVLVTMVAAAFYAAFFGMGAQMLRQGMTTDTDAAAKNAIERIIKDAKEAVGIISSHAGNTTGTSVLILRLPSLDATGRPTNIASQFDHVIYRLDTNVPSRLTRTLDVLNGTSLREGGADTNDSVISQYVSGLQFSSGGTVFSSMSSTAIQAVKRFNVQITTQRTMFGTVQQTSLDSDVVLRNRIT